MRQDPRAASGSPRAAATRSTSTRRRATRQPRAARRSARSRPLSASAVLRDGTLDRAALAELVFADAAARARLNAIVHPRVRALEAALGGGAAGGRRAGDRRGAARRDRGAPALRPAGGRALRARAAACAAPCARRPRRALGPGADRGADAAAGSGRFAHFAIDSSGSSRTPSAPPTPSSRRSGALAERRPRGAGETGAAAAGRARPRSARRPARARAGGLLRLRPSAGSSSWSRSRRGSRRRRPGPGTRRRARRRRAPRPRRSAPRSSPGRSVARAGRRVPGVGRGLSRAAHPRRGGAARRRVPLALVLQEVALAPGPAISRSARERSGPRGGAGAAATRRHVAPVLDAARAHPTRPRGRARGGSERAGRGRGRSRARGRRGGGRVATSSPSCSSESGAAAVAEDCGVAGGSATMAALKLAIIQPSYIPWRGYFHQIQKADVFLFYDDVQYDKHGWRNRNRVKTANGTIWLTIPVAAAATWSRAPRSTRSAAPRSTGRASTGRRCSSPTAGAPHFERYAPLLEEFYARRGGAPRRASPST